MTENKKDYKFKPRTEFLYPSEVFDNTFKVLLEWELATIVAESNSWKTTFAMDMIDRNAARWIKWFYFNLEFPIQVTYERKWLWYNGKDKSDLGHGKLTEYEQKDLENYVNEQLKKYQYCNEPNGISLDRLEQVMEIAALDDYKLFVIDTFSRIHWNLERNARDSQNRCMERLQELAQRLNVWIIALHHTNRQGTREWSQKIMDLSNVFIVLERIESPDEDGIACTNYKLMKDKYVANVEQELYYYKGQYLKEYPKVRTVNKPF